MLAINRTAPTACTSATANAALDSPSSTANSRSIRSFWFSTFSTPGWPAIDIVEVLVLLGIVQLDDERRREGVLPRDVLVLRELLDRVVVGVVAVEKPHGAHVVARPRSAAAAPCTDRRRRSGRWPRRRWSKTPGSRPGPGRWRASCRPAAPPADRHRTGRWRSRWSGSSRPSW